MACAGAWGRVTAGNLFTALDVWRTLANADDYGRYVEPRTVRPTRHGKRERNCRFAGSDSVVRVSIDLCGELGPDDYLWHIPSMT